MKVFYSYMYIFLDCVYLNMYIYLFLKRKFFLEIDDVEGIMEEMEVG